MPVLGFALASLFSPGISARSEPRTEPPEHILSGEVKNVKPTWLHVRNEPTRFGTIVGILRQRDNVKVLKRDVVWEMIGGQRSIWVKISTGELTGWVFGGFLTETGQTMLSDALEQLFTMPLQTGVYFRTDRYGARRHPISGRPSFHSGIDLAAPIGTPVLAAADGIIEREMDFSNDGYGRLTVIRHENGLVTYYAHQSVFSKKVGDRVEAGEQIGEVGNTGASSGPHLHFEVRTSYGSKHFDPDKYLLRFDGPLK